MHNWLSTQYLGHMAHKSTAFPPHLFDVDDLSTAQAETLLDLAGEYVKRNRQKDKKHPVLKGRTLINLFFESSTRTRASFELAGKRLGMDVINLSASVSSVNKGESLLDTIATLNAMQADAIVLRHPQASAPELVKGKVDGSLINAGDGCHAHPTQALLDAFTIRAKKGHIKGLTVAICGDILHSRVARSNTRLLGMLGAKIRWIAPPTLMPIDVTPYHPVETYYHVDDGLKDADIIMMLRLQKERMTAPSVASVRDYFARYGLTYERLAQAKADALILHPGPVNRGVEMTYELADDLERTAILEQVEAGVAVRQALLEMLLKDSS